MSRKISGVLIIIMIVITILFYQSTSKHFSKLLDNKQGSGSTNTFEVMKPTHALMFMLNDAEQWYQMKTKTHDWHLA